MGRYKVYSDYKISELEYIDQVPVHWREASLSKLFIINAGGDVLHRYFSDEKTQEHKYPIYTNANDSTAVYGYTSKPNYSKNSITVSGRGEVGFAVFRDHAFDAIIRLLVLNPRVECDCRYFAYFINAVIDFNVQSSAIGQLSTLQIAPYKVLIPDCEEQVQIANFLDHETAKIDTLIKKQQQLIKLLKEKRQAVISHAVTKGLNPEAPMKDSGVEWLGQVPEHWGVSSLGYYSSLNTGATPDRSKPSYWDGDIPWIKTGEVKYETIYISEEHISQHAIKNTSVKISPPGTLLMAMYGQGITRGRVALLGVDATYNQACVAISPNRKLQNLYLKAFFIAGYHAIRDGGNETSQMNLNADIVRKFKIAVPTLEEQHSIVQFLDLELPKFDNLIIRAENAIILMQERRTALISAAVTGKIDVRHWQPPQQQDQPQNQSNAEEVIA